MDWGSGCVALLRRLLCVIWRGAQPPQVGVDASVQARRHYLTPANGTYLGMSVATAFAVCGLDEPPEEVKPVYIYIYYIFKGVF